MQSPGSLVIANSTAPLLLRSSNRWIVCLGILFDTLQLFSPPLHACTGQDWWSIRRLPWFADCLFGVAPGITVSSGVASAIPCFCFSCTAAKSLLAAAVRVAASAACCCRSWHWLLHPLATFLLLVMLQILPSSLLLPVRLLMSLLICAAANSIAIACVALDRAVRDTGSTSAVSGQVVTCLCLCSSTGSFAGQVAFTAVSA